MISQKVFINCPYDKKYKNFFECIIFLCCYFGFEPCFASEFTDTSPRIDKIVHMIKTSKYAIHDISRKYTECGQLPRFNMVFELGMDFIYKKHLKKGKKILVIDGVDKDYEKCLSDLKCVDIEAHNNNLKKLIIIVSNFLVPVSGISHVLSAGEIEKKFKLEFKYWIETNTKESIKNIEMSVFKRETINYFKVANRNCQ